MFFLKFFLMTALQHTYCRITSMAGTLFMNVKKRPKISSIMNNGNSAQSLSVHTPTVAVALGRASDRLPSDAKLAATQLHRVYVYKGKRKKEIRTKQIR